MNNDTLLYRQVHPSWIQDGQITSQVFIPTPKDEKMLSAYDGDIVSSQDSWIHYTGELGNESDGVVAVSYEECAIQNVTPLPDPETFDAHVLIDYSSQSESKIRKRISKELKSCALNRGWLYQP
ncbi:MAG TPA: hypothetical protein VN631_15245 [Negativicutes bacterium]|nr:hypothetical protein [Negativicutes bacterium]